MHRERIDKDINKEKWNGKINNIVQPGFYNYKLQIEGKIFKGKFYVSDEI